jgi:hypothetical protein
MALVRRTSLRVRLERILFDVEFGVSRRIARTKGMQAAERCMIGGNGTVS